MNNRNTTFNCYLFSDVIIHTQISRPASNLLNMAIRHDNVIRINLKIFCKAALKEYVVL